VLTFERQRIRDVGALDDRQAGTAEGADLDALTGADGRPLVVRVFGEDLGVLRQEAERMRRLLATVDGVVEPRVEPLVEQPAVAIEVDLTRAQRYGIKAGDVRRAAATLLSGIQVGSLFEQQKVFEVVVRATPATRRSLTDIRRLLIDVPDGGHVRLGQIADVRVRPTPQVIQRDASSRRIDVSAGVGGRGLGDVRRDVERRLARVGFPLEYHAEVIADPTGPGVATLRLAGLALAAALGILLLLQAAVRSWRLAAASLLVLPGALVGGELVALAGGGAVSLGSLLGLLAVLGIAARQGVVLLAHTRRLERRADGGLAPAVAVRGARDRLAPILTTTLATAAALAPFALLGERAGYEVVHPMAMVMVGGLVTSALLSLFVLPVLYARFGAGQEPESDLELLYRWSGLEPEPEDAAVATNGPAWVGAGVHPREGK
jgi:Cu/Ag efflux pump CusA